MTKSSKQKANKQKNAIEPPVLLLTVVQHLFVKRIAMTTLILTTLVSAFFLVLLTHEKRQLFAELESLNKERDELDIEWRELTLEQRMLGEHSRLQKVASDNLGMKTLDLKSERIVKQVKDSE